MAYNKSKHVENAQKYLHQEKLAQAINEYQNVLKHEPKDQVTLMTIGDLYVRQGETFQALEYFERLAKLFLNDGFVTKAIAIYKKIAKLAPEETRYVERLAELYVQQGVLSEARPIYLQLADVHERAGRQPQAAVLLRKLIEAEPDNLRVQTRLAELSESMGRPGEAVSAYLAASEQLQRRGNHAQAIVYADRALKVRPEDLPAATLKARALAAAGQHPDAIALLKTLASLETGNEPADLLLDLYLEHGAVQDACELATKIAIQNPRRFAPAYQVACKLLEMDDAQGALPLLGLVREAMADAGEHESLSQSLLGSSERLPDQIEPREWLVELYERANDSFRLPDALATLAAAYEKTGADDRAKRTYEKLLERDPENQGVLRKYQLLRVRTGESSSTLDQDFALAVDEPEPPAAVSSSAFALDEATQQFVTQALIDVDLFSGYGLKQKAIDLLEVARERAPFHVPTLERLLDLSLGGADDSRTSELAAQLEKIHVDRGELGPAQRFAELRRRFERAAGLAQREAVASGATSEESADTAAETVPGLEELVSMALAVQSQQAAPPGAAHETIEILGDPAVHEVDLSEEWAALAAAIEAEEPPPLQDSAAVAEFVMTPTEVPADFDVAALPEDASGDPEIQPAISLAPAEQAAASLAQPITLEDIPGAELPAPEHVLNSASEETPVFTSNDFLQSLSGELDEIAPARATDPVSDPAVQSAGEPVRANGGTMGHAHDAPQGPLSDMFNDFRADMGEHSVDDQDPETHYNLGIAYREMGLLEEAISEFQKVAKMDKQGRAFRYTMQCCTLLGLAFMDKGQPSIAAMWYESALQTPGLEQESILALRYDLGVAQEMSGDISAARKSFSQVYGANIDYRDVAERLAALGKGH